MTRGQVWIETVIYTLVGLSLIGLVLGLVTPKINEYKDRAVIEQTISSLNVIDGKINEVLQAPGNVRAVNIRMKRGDLYVDPMNDSLYFVLVDSHVAYSQVGQKTSIGRIQVFTENAGKLYRITLTLPYSVDLTYTTGEIKKFSATATPYTFSFSDKGLNSTTGREVVEVRELSGA